MKTVKIAGIILGSLTLLVVIAVGVALSSGFQTWAVRKAVADQPGLTLEVGSVSAGFSSAQITGLRVVQPGLTLSVASVSTRHSAWAFLTSRRVDLDDLEIKGLVVDLRTPAAAAAAAPATPTSAQPAATGTKSAPKTASVAPAAKPNEPRVAFSGLLKKIVIPFPVRLARLSAEGKALLLDQQQVVFDLKGAGIESAKRGKLDWTVDYSDATANAPIRAVRATGTVHVSLAVAQRLDALELEATAAAMGPNIPSDQIKFTARIAQPTATGDEDYATNLSLIRRGQAESLLNAKARFAAGVGEIAGTWEIALRSEQLAALLAGFGLPEVAATGAGKFSLKPASTAAAASGTLQASVTQLQKLSPALAAIGAVRLKSAFDGSVADNAAHLNSFEIDLADGSDRRVAHLNLLQKVTYRLADRHVTLANSRAEAARFTLQAVPLAWAQPVAQPMTVESGTLSLVLAVEAEPDGSRLRVRAVEPLALRDVTLRDAQKKALVERVTLTALPAIDYTTEKLSAQIGELKLAMNTGDSLSGAISADVTNLAKKPVTAFRAQLQAKLVTLQKPFVAFDPGPLTASVQAEGRHEGDLLQVAQATAAVNRDGGALLAAVELLQPIRADLKAATFAATNPAAVAARVRLGTVPLAWAEPYVAHSKLSGSLTGTTLEITLRSLEDVTLTTTEPVLLREVTAALEGKPLVQALDVSASLSATKRKDVIAYDLRRLEIKQGATALVLLNASGQVKPGAKLAAAAKGTLETDAGALLRQPGLSSLANLSRGRVTAAFDVASDDATQAKVVLSAKSLAGKPDPRDLGDVDLTLHANLKADGSGTVSAPLTVTVAGRKSDLQFEGSFGKAADQKTAVFTGKLSSTNLVADDLQALAGLAPSSAPATSAAPAPAAGPRPGSQPAPAARPGAAPAPTRDTKPFWQGVNGRAEVDLKRVLYGKDYTIRAIKGTASITNTRLALDNLEGSFRDKPFKLASTITFAPTQPQPYALTGLVDVAGVEVGELLRATNPKEKPMLETTVKVAAKLTGSGATLPALLERTYGTFDVSGSKGVLRALGRKGETVSTASTLLGLAGAVAGSSNTMALGRLGQELEEMQFETFTLKVERDAALNMKFSAIEFLSPNKRLTGTGGVTYAEGKPYDQWPFQFEFKLAGKDFMAQLLNEARALSGAQDDKGYYPMAVSFPVSGTAAAVNNGLWKILAGTAARAGLESFLRR